MQRLGKRQLAWISVAQRELKEAARRGPWHKAPLVATDPPVFVVGEYVFTRQSDALYICESLGIEIHGSYEWGKRALPFTVCRRIGGVQEWVMYRPRGRCDKAPYGSRTGAAHGALHHFFGHRPKNGKKGKVE